MSIEQIKDNIFRITTDTGACSINLENVMWGSYNATTKKSTLVCEAAATGPASVVMHGDFRALVAGSGRDGTNSGPVFGIFTDTGAGKTPVIVNFSQLNYAYGNSGWSFGSRGTSSGFAFTLLEAPDDVIGNTGHSLQDIGIFTMTNVQAAPIQGFINIKHVVQQTPNAGSELTQFVDGTLVHFLENIADLVGA